MEDENFVFNSNALADTEVKQRTLDEGDLSEPVLVSRVQHMQPNRIEYAVHNKQESHHLAGGSFGKTDEFLNFNLTSKNKESTDNSFVKLEMMCNNMHDENRFNHRHSSS